MYATRMISPLCGGIDQAICAKRLSQLILNRFDVFTLYGNRRGLPPLFAGRLTVHLRIFSLAFHSANESKRYRVGPGQTQRLVEQSMAAETRLFALQESTILMRPLYKF